MIENGVVVVTSDACPNCELIKSYFGKLNIPYTILKVVDLDSKQKTWIELNNEGSRSLPQVFIDKEFVGVDVTTIFAFANELKKEIANGNVAGL
jgi:glutaredoxin